MPKEMVKVRIKSTPGGVESWRIYAETDDGKLLPVSAPENNPITIRCEGGLIKATLTLIIDEIDLAAEVNQDG